LHEYIQQFDEKLELSDQAFQSIFNVLDTNKDELITRIEMVGFINKFTA